MIVVVTATGQVRLEAEGRGHHRGRAPQRAAEPDPAHDQTS